VLLAILVFALVGKQETWIMILSRILLLPVIAALGYEYTQLGARHMDKAFMKVLMAPGLWLQKLTTREPDNSQLEVAIAALKEVLATDQESVPASASGARAQRFGFHQHGVVIAVEPHLYYDELVA
jgi:uncharacterized protein YqhQ